MRRGDLAYERLREDIVSLGVQPLQPLNEVELAAQLGVSRTPVREALMRLQREGLVESVPGKGWVASQISLRDVVEMFQMREALEPLAARLCAEQGDQPLFARLTKRFEDLADSEPAATSEVVEELDQALLDQCGNRRLAASLEELTGHRMRLRAVSVRSPERIVVANEEHAKICRAIANRSPDEAHASTAIHVRNSLQVILDALVKQATSGQLRIAM